MRFDFGHGYRHAALLRFRLRGLMPVKLHSSPPNDPHRPYVPYIR